MEHQPVRIVRDGVYQSYRDQIQAVAKEIRDLATELYLQTDGSGGGPTAEYGEHMLPADAFDQLQNHVAEMSSCLDDLLFAVEKLHRQETDDTATDPIRPPRSS